MANALLVLDERKKDFLSWLAQNIDEVNENGIILDIQYGVDFDIYLDLDNFIIDGEEKVKYFLLNGEEKPESDADFKNYQLSMLEEREKKKNRSTKESNTQVIEHNPFDDGENDEKEEKYEVNDVEKIIMQNTRKVKRLDLTSHFVSKGT